MSALPPATQRATQPTTQPTTKYETQPAPPRWRELARIVRRPVRDESRALLADNWARLPEALRTPRQMLGRQGNGCGATIGAMPRCDFACRGCYLGDGANKVPAAGMEELKAQMRALRPILGPAGNLQLTDGEVTLRDADEVIELLQYARSLELIPMLMTHGDSFRRRPGLLERLITEGGLRELSIHVDTTQRGRKGAQWTGPTGEAALNPLRDEFAEMLRSAMRTTGIRVRSATTLTVTRDNLDHVPDVMRWLVHNADVFHVISFQPIAQVGRTEDGFGGGVTADALWEKVAEGLADHHDAPAAMLDRGAKWLGHPACNRFVHGLVYRTDAGQATFHPVRDDADPVDRRIVDGFLARFGGISFRGDEHRRTRVARMLGVLAQAPTFVAGSLLPYAVHWMRRFGAGRPLSATRALVTGRARVNGLAIISHHFMSAEEIATPLGQERLDQCVFHLSVNGERKSMCEVNALGIREAYYAQLTRSPARAPAGRQSSSASGLPTLVSTAGGTRGSHPSNACP